jgi:hypothetical protein
METGISANARNDAWLRTCSHSEHRRRHGTGGGKPLQLLALDPAGVAVAPDHRSCRCEDAQREQGQQDREQYVEHLVGTVDGERVRKPWDRRLFELAGSEVEDDRQGHDRGRAHPPHGPPAGGGQVTVRE